MQRRDIIDKLNGNAVIVEASRSAAIFIHVGWLEKFRSVPWERRPMVHGERVGPEWGHIDFMYYDGRFNTLDYLPGMVEYRMALTCMPSVTKEEYLEADAFIKNPAVSFEYL